MYQSIPSLTISPVGPRGVLLNGLIPQPRAQRNSKNPTPGAKKIILKLHPRGKYFQKLRDNNKSWDRNYGKQ